MNNGTASFVIPYDAEGNGSLYSVKRQEMSHSITCLGMREERKTLNEPMREGFVCCEMLSTLFSSPSLTVIYDDLFNLQLVPSTYLCCTQFSKVRTVGRSVGR